MLDRKAQAAQFVQVSQHAPYAEVDQSSTSRQQALVSLAVYFLWIFLIKKLAAGVKLYRTSKSDPALKSLLGIS